MSGGGNRREWPEAVLWNVYTGKANYLLYAASAKSAEETVREWTFGRDPIISVERA